MCRRPRPLDPTLRVFRGTGRGRGCRWGSRFESGGADFGEERVSELTRRCVGLWRCWEGAGEAQVGRWRPTFTALGSAHTAATLQEARGCGGPSRHRPGSAPADSHNQMSLDSTPRSPAVCVSGPEPQRTFECMSGGWGLFHPRRSSFIFLNHSLRKYYSAFSGRLCTTSSGQRKQEHWA